MKHVVCQLTFVGALLAGSPVVGFAHDSASVVPDIAEKAVHGVVNISTTQKRNARSNSDPLHQWFLGDAHRE